MKLKLTLASFLSVLGLAGALFTFAPSASAGLFEDAKKDACGGAELKGVGSDCTDANTSQLDNTIQTIVNILTVVIGIVAVIMIIINGFKFITSGGDSNKVSSAKNGIIWAIVGLVIVAVAQFIVQFAINASKPPVTPPTPPTSTSAPAGQGAPAPRPPGGASGGTRNVAP